MASKKATPAASQNSTLIGTELTLGKHTYHLFFDFSALTKAESALKAQGIQANLLKALNLQELDANGVAALFYATLLKNHPETSFEDVIDMLNKPKALGKILDAVLSAYMAAQADEDEESPKE